MLEEDAWGGWGGMLCAGKGDLEVTPNTPTPSLPTSFLPPPRRGLSPGALVTWDALCMLGCMHVRQDGDGDGVRKEDGRVTNF